MAEENVRVDYASVWSEIVKRKKLYLRVLPISFIIACILIFPQPRYYSCQVMLAPENTEDMGDLSSLASQFGFSVGGNSNDAIYPMLYPDLFESTNFIVGILGIKVPYTHENGKKEDMDYYSYLTKYQKKNPLTYPFLAGKKALMEWISPSGPSERKAGDVTKLNPFLLSREDAKLVEDITKLISCSVDKKTDVTTISVIDQDPLVCATLADSLCVRLQEFITDYRTSKARLDMAYYENLTNQAKKEYEESMSAYSKYCDMHRNATMQTYINEQNRLENDMLTKQNSYQALYTQYSATQAKVQEKTPAFTILSAASVPVKPAGPKRMIFVASVLVFAFIGTSVYILKDIIKEVV